MPKLPAYDVISWPSECAPQHIALRGFQGFEPIHANSYAAWIVADDDVRFIVLQPEARTSWSPENEEAFRERVIALAKESPRLLNASTVGVYFDPASIPEIRLGYVAATAPEPDVIVR